MKWYQYIVLTGLMMGVIQPGVSQAAFDFPLQDLQGKTHTLSEHRGKWVLVNFWATWCPPCREEMPALSILHDDNPDIVVLGVNYHEADKEKIAQFLDEMLVDFPNVLLPEPKELPGMKPVRALPTSLLVSPQGALVSQFSGLVNTQAVLDYIKGHK